MLTWHWWWLFSLVIARPLVSPNVSILKRVASQQSSNATVEAQATNIIVEKLDAMRKDANYGILKINEAFVKDFLLVTPLPFTLILVATAESNLCPYCGELRRLLAEAMPYLESPDAGAKPIRDGEGRPVYVGELIATAHRGVAKLLELDTVPALLLINDDTLKCISGDGDRIEACPVKDGGVLALKTAIQDPQELVVSFYQALGREDILQSDRTSRFHRTLIHFGIPILIIGTIGLSYFETLRNLVIKRPQIIAGFALVSFFISTSGIIYNLQHNMELLGYNFRTKQTLWINPQQRQQYLGEGLLFSGICVLGSISFYIGIRLPKLLKKRPFWENKIVIINLAAMIMMLLGAIAYHVAQVGLDIKRLSARPSFFPDGMTRGSVRVDRMYSF
eukprot:Protomagalhaensia_wolfi_Nauph_80__1492@NODE_1902_length_1284_cov_9_654618_g1489_i0_p1_GENE_NODE_1902_length_1284_cov_9_654618_g1489_i0NODE_1902_length_1284_cov_9_654618_g1489_i0_p1_ORF_typecomplete_len392_score55_05OST3_OST6/PF04756_13/1_2e23_NODE_1902_length_1284_cov_9_654618_g1489_i0681243